MKLPVLALLCLGLAACSSPTTEPPVAEAPPAAPVAETAPPPVVATDHTSLQGVWKLVSYEQNEPGGIVSFPYSETPIGRLTFDAAGRTSLFVMKPDRFASVNSAAAIPLASVADLRQIADGFIALYGSYEVDDSTQTIVTKVEAATIPAWTDSQQKRAYELSGDTLALIAPNTKLTWTRLPN